MSNVHKSYLLKAKKVSITTVDMFHKKLISK